MAPSHEIFVTIENILKSPFILTSLGISISSLILFIVLARKTKSSKSEKVRSSNRLATNKGKSATTKKSSEPKKATTKQNSAAKSASDKSKRDQQQQQQANKKNKEAEAKKKEASKKQEADSKKAASQLERKIKVVEANPRQLNDRSQNKDEGGWIKLVSRREKRERSAKLKELKAGESSEAKIEAKEKKPYRGPRDVTKRSTPSHKRT